MEGMEVLVGVTTANDDYGNNREGDGHAGYILGNQSLNLRQNLAIEAGRAVVGDEEGGMQKKRQLGNGHLCKDGMEDLSLFNREAGAMRYRKQ